MDIQDKVAIVTGGASGLGHATAQRLLAKGAKVMIFDMAEERAKEVKQTLGSNVDYAVVNVADEDSVKAGLSKAQELFGSVHICVNCAGIATAGKTLGRNGALALTEFSKTIQVNLIGTFNVLRLSAEIMATNTATNEDGEKGVIINTASVAAFDGQIGQAAYSASKGGVAGMTLPIARDLAPSGIRVLTIAPGIMNTPMMAGMPEKVREPLIAMTQFPKRLGLPDEYGLLVTQIVENSFLNAEVIRLDGGIRMSPR